MGATENYDISWKNFESRMSHSFADIRNHEQFLDVTLAADTADGSVEALRAHKVILSACSPVLRTLLTKQQALTPYSPFMPIMLYLRGISARDLNHVLEFIYKGSVSLAQDELNDFLAVAESLQIPLGEEAGEPETKPVPTKRFAPPPGGGGEPSKRAKMIPPKPERKPPILPPPDDDGDDIEVTTPQMVKMEPSAGASGGAVPPPPEPEVSIEGEEYDESYEQYGDDAFDDPGAGTSAGGAAATKGVYSQKAQQGGAGFACEVSRNSHRGIACNRMGKSRGLPVPCYIFGGGRFAMFGMQLRRTGSCLARLARFSVPL